MAYLDDREDTICAVSTPPGHGGVAVIRVSGLKSLEVTRQIAPFLPEKMESHRIYYGILRSGEENLPIDEVLISYFAKGRSFTGEQTIEISCHGGVNITQEVLQQLLYHGARAAHRGEFTFRAFTNGKMDLVQAEAVLGLIESRSRASSRMALSQLQGRLSKELNQLEDSLTRMLAHLEASIDFSTEDIDVVSMEVWSEEIRPLIERVERLLQSYRQGRVIQEGLKVFLVGAPNAGKSSWLNALIGEDRAIVTDLPGTTRDFVEAELRLNGHGVMLTDTAGLRKATDSIESLGIARTQQSMSRADRVVWVLDLSQPLSGDGFFELQEADLFNRPPEEIILLGNKRDKALWGNSLSDFKDRLISQLNEILPGKDLEMWFQKIPDDQILTVSCQSPSDRERVLKAIESSVFLTTGQESAVVCQTRHFEGLQVVEKSLNEAQKLMDMAAGAEFVCFELKDALIALRGLQGKEVGEEVLDRVFKEFCLGK